MKAVKNQVDMTIDGNLHDSSESSKNFEAAFNKMKGDRDGSGKISPNTPSNKLIKSIQRSVGDKLTKKTTVGASDGSLISQIEKLKELERSIERIILTLSDTKERCLDQIKKAKDFHIDSKILSNYHDSYYRPAEKSLTSAQLILSSQGLPYIRKLRLELEGMQANLGGK